MSLARHLRAAARMTERYLNATTLRDDFPQEKNARKADPWNANLWCSAALAAQSGVDSNQIRISTNLRYVYHLIQVELSTWLIRRVLKAQAGGSRWLLSNVPSNLNMIPSIWRTGSGHHNSYTLASQWWCLCFNIINDTLLPRERVGGNKNVTGWSNISP